uniref:Shroom2 n=1 Tax=Gouania willdenowi TaxID=441366 RepID=A0A8C5G333_GOUWI
MFQVEEGSKAAAVSLQVGDELVNINEIPLSGFRQEAICLVKGSHKTLSLVVKRRNEPISRPHSWHSTKFNENQSETAKTQSPPTAVWHARYDASSSSNDLSTGWEQTNLRRVSDQFSSLGSMDSLEQVSHPYPAGQLSPAKSNNSMEHLGGGKRDSAYSSFSTSSGTPDYTLSKSNAASTENMLYKVNQWDTGGKQSNGKLGPNLSAERVAQDDRVTYFQMPGVTSGFEGPQIKEVSGSRPCTSSRASVGPIWNVPEKIKTTSPSPPPPLPPARSDSFAATKVHERGLMEAHPEGSDSLGACKNFSEDRRSHNVCPKHRSDRFYSSSEISIPGQFGSNKQHSLSSSDVRQGHPSQISQSYQQVHHSDKSPVYPQPRGTSLSKLPSTDGSCCSLQELPTNSSAHHQRRNLSPSLSSKSTEHSMESSGPSRYYCVSTCQPKQTNNSLSLSSVPKDRNNATFADPPLAGNEIKSFNSQPASQVKGQMPQQQQHSSQSKDSNGCIKHLVPAVRETTMPKSSSNDTKGHANQHEAQYASCHLTGQTKEQRSLPLQHKEFSQDVQYRTQVSSKINPQATPMLHSLSMDSAESDERTKSQTTEESLEDKQVKRSDRFATTLRNEILMRRAKLQKSKSAATLPSQEGEIKESLDTWKSAESTTPTSNSYKDHLKEAQARVLKATSFRRRDLEPVLLELSTPEALSNYPASCHARSKEVNTLPTLTELATNHSRSASSQVTRIGSRKRFSAEKKVKSFSEPDKIHEVGIKENLDFHETASSSLDQQKLLDENEEPGYPNHLFLQSQIKSQEQYNVLNSSEKGTLKATENKEQAEEAKGTPYSAQKQSTQDQQRLGTFAEYEARWTIQQKPSEKRASGRYRSADNIVDPGPEGKDKSTCFHERSRSSPSADFYGQKIPVPARKSDTEYCYMESKPAEQLERHTRYSDRTPGDCRGKEKAGDLEHSPTPPPPPPSLPPPMTGADSDCRHRPAPAPINHRPSSVCLSATESRPEHRRKSSMPEKPPRSRYPEVADSHEPFAGSQSEAFTHCSSNADPGSAFSSTQSVKAEQGTGPVDRGQGPEQHLNTVNPQPVSSPPASSHRAVELTMEEPPRSPSPQFSPRRLSDKPPVTFQSEDSNRIEHRTDGQKTSGTKVPIRIVHSEGSTEKEKSPFLQHFEPPAALVEGRAVTMGAAGQDSVFCAFTRQREHDSSPQKDAYLTTVGEQHPEENPNSSTVCSSGGSTLEEDQKREELTRDIVGKDKSLADILDQTKMKTTMDLMEGIFPEGEQLLEGAQQRRKVQPKQSNARPAEESKEKEDSMAAAVTMVTSSTYYSTSAPKAELLIKMKDMQELQEEEEEDSEDELDIDLANKKQELIDSLSKKLQVLREARESLQEDILDNNALGEEVEARVQQVCKPNELDKFRMFVGDLDKVVSLLLSLSGRLARVENAINSLEEDATPEEKRTLIEKRKLLIRQHEDAKELKENLDRRERIVFDILAHYLPEDGMTDYNHFVKMKSALIIEQRKLEDKVKLGEEQLKCLMDSLPIEQRLLP